MVLPYCWTPLNVYNSEKDYQLIKTIEVSSSIKITTSTPVVDLRVKSNLSGMHIRTAVLFANECKRIENEESRLEWPQPRYDELKSYASASIIMSVASLEASINELFLEAIDNNKNSLKSISEQQIALLSVLWEEAEKFSILKKYQVALSACGKPPIDAGKEPYQSASALITLRNALVHYKPEWDDKLKKHQQIENRLSGRFNNNQLSERAKGIMSWFPGKCLGAGAARWGCDIAVEFSNQFCQVLKIERRLSV